MKLRLFVSGIAVFFLALSPASGDDASGDAAAASEASDDTCTVVCFDDDNKACGMGTADTCEAATAKAMKVCDGAEVHCRQYRRGELPRLSPVESDGPLDEPCTYCVWDGHQYSPGARLCQGNGFVTCKANGHWSAKSIGAC